ncbi:MAG: ATP-binding protein [Rectinemataceae bacterium]
MRLKMDSLRNPFAPGAGSPPPELVGRSEVLEEVRVLLGRIRNGRSEKSLLLNGLRGVGKTVLLNEIDRMAEESGYRTILIEAVEDKSLPAMLAPQLRKLLFSIDRMAGAGDKAKKALAALKSFVSAVKVNVGEIELGLDIEPLIGVGDSGDLEVDLPDLLLSVAEAAAERGTAVAILIDEIQYFSAKELSALVMAMHRMQQKSLPLVLVGAGLPILPALAGEAKSYAERLFSFPLIGALGEEDANLALQEPVKKEGVSFDDDALAFIFRQTRGYPYFIQEWGYQAWNLAGDSPITEGLAAKATLVVKKRLDANFFRVRFDRLTPKEKSYLRAMAELGEGPMKTSDIAAALAAKVASLGPVRASLLRKGMVYSPSFGEMAFTVPLFDDSMRRIMPKGRSTLDLA